MQKCHATILLIQRKYVLSKRLSLLLKMHGVLTCEWGWIIFKQLFLMKRSLVTLSFYEHFFPGFIPRKSWFLQPAEMVSMFYYYLLFQKLLCQIPELPVSLLTIRVMIDLQAHWVSCAYRGEQEWQKSSALGPVKQTPKKLGLVWGTRKKISQIINAYLYLPFFLLIILWFWPVQGVRTSGSVRSTCTMSPAAGESAAQRNPSRNIIPSWAASVLPRNGGFWNCCITTGI
jgi:hypothetical protein